jgi:hypothetical protein
VDLQTVMAYIAAAGGIGGIATTATVLLQRRKLKADAAEVLTDTALALLQPLRDRIDEMDREARIVTGILRRWTVAILSPTADVQQLRRMVLAEPRAHHNGTHLPE